jgi:hypothetical protein
MIVSQKFSNPQLTINRSQISGFHLQSEQQKLVSLAGLQLANITWQQKQDQLSLEKNQFAGLVN